MNIPKIEPIPGRESQTMIHSFSTLISGYNSWCDIVDLFHKNETLRDKYKEVMSDMMKDGNCGMSTAMVCSILELVSELEELRMERV